MNPVMTTLITGGGAGIGLALLDPAIAEGDEVVVDVRGRQARFTVTKPPFVPPHVR